MRTPARGLLLLTMLLHAGDAAAQTAPLRLEPLARIGCADCDGAALLTQVRAIRISAARIHVLDATAPHVRIFDLGGRVVRSFGRAGDGPGEFRFPLQLELRGAGQIEVWDYTHGRLTLLDSLGVSRGTRLLPLGMFPNLATHPATPTLYAVTGDARDTVQRLVRIAPTDSLPVPLPWLGNAFPVDQVTRSIARPAIAIRPDGGVAVGAGRGAYRIRLFAADGTPDGDIARSIPRVRKTRDELEAERQQQERLRGMMAERLPGNAQLPAYRPDPERPHFAGFRFDDEGRLWVRTRRGDPDRTVFDLFDTQRRYLGEVTLPLSIGSYDVRAGMLAAAVRDAYGVEFINVWRIRSSGG